MAAAAAAPKGEAAGAAVPKGEAAGAGAPKGEAVTAGLGAKGLVAAPMLVLLSFEFGQSEMQRS